MRLKFSLLVKPEVSGDVLPISYQYGLVSVFRQILSSDKERYDKWLKANGINHFVEKNISLFSISNLYIPKILVEGDRLKICVPRIQFWVSFIPDIGTIDFVRSVFEGQSFVLGDNLTSVAFDFLDLEEVSPINYVPVMEYQTLSPIVVKAFRQNNTLEYLNPNHPVFSEFMIEDLIDRWEQYYNCPFTGIRGFTFTMLSQERRKAVSINMSGDNGQKMVGYMLKFRLEMDPELQHFAYVSGLGNEIKNGFGYIELIRKKK